MTIVKLTMPASQWSQFYFCNYIIICSIESEMRDEAICSFIACLGLHAENTNKVTEPILWSLWSWHCQLHNGYKKGSVALLVFAVEGPKCCNSARWQILQVTLCLGAQIYHLVTVRAIILPWSQAPTKNTAVDIYRWDRHFFLFLAEGHDYIAVKKHN